MVYFRSKGVKAVENLARPASEDDEAYQSHVRLRDRAERQAFILGEQAKARAALKRQVREDREVWKEVDQEYSTLIATPGVLTPLASSPTPAAVSSLNPVPVNP